MELIVEARRSGLARAVTRDPSREQEATRVVHGEGVLAARQTEPYSFAADCECPDDCLRDHANE
jgi:hypothetical protein